MRLGGKGYRLHYGLCLLNFFFIDKSLFCDAAAHFCIWLNLTTHVHAAEMLQLCVLHKLHVATAVCLVKVKLLIFPLLCKRGTMWTRARCGRRSGTADGYFNKAHGEDEELWNHYQVLVCVSGRVNECLDNTAVTPTPPLHHWPTSPLRGIKPLHAVIAFADPLTDPIGSWENGINWWSNPATAEICEQVTLLSSVGAATTHVGDLTRLPVVWCEYVYAWGLTSGPVCPRHHAYWWGCWQFSALTGWLSHGLCVW